MNRAYRRQRVLSLVEAAQRLAYPSDPVGVALRPRLVKTTGLSPEGVELALRDHLETRPSEAEVDSLLECTGQSPAVHVLLSANVFVAGLRALCLAVATAPQVVVRCSSREDQFVPALLSAVESESLRASVTLQPTLMPHAGEELHLYGSDATIAQVCSELEPGVLVRAHGSGFGLALVAEGSEPAEAAAELARDIVPFDQQGCLSPRVALVQGIDRASSFAAALAKELQSWHQRVPFGSHSLEEQVRFRDTALTIGDWIPAGPGGVALVREPRTLWLGPPLRNVVVLNCEEPQQASRLVSAVSRQVTALGLSGQASEFFASVLGICAGARLSPLGTMQQPPFDGPVDRRQMGTECPSEVVRRLARLAS